jgi:hypothetical protein
VQGDSVGISDDFFFAVDLGGDVRGVSSGIVVKHAFGLSQNFCICNQIVCGGSKRNLIPVRVKVRLIRVGLGRLMLGWLR